MVNAGAWCCQDMLEGGKDGTGLNEEKKKNTRQYNQNNDLANWKHSHHNSQCNALNQKQGYIPTPRIYDSLPYQFRLPRAYFESISHCSDSRAAIGSRDVKQRKVRSPLQKILYDSENSIRSTERSGLRQNKRKSSSSNVEFSNNYIKTQKDSKNTTDEKLISQRKDVGLTKSVFSENFITESENKLTNVDFKDPKRGEKRNEVTYHFNEEDLFKCPESKKVDVESVDNINENHYFEESGNKEVEFDATLCEDEEQILKNLLNKEAENNKIDNSSEGNFPEEPMNEEVKNDSTNYYGQEQIFAYSENQQTELDSTNPMGKEQTYYEIQNQKVDNKITYETNKVKFLEETQGQENEYSFTNYSGQERIFVYSENQQTELDATTRSNDEEDMFEDCFYEEAENKLKENRSESYLPTDYKDQKRGLDAINHTDGVKSFEKPRNQAASNESTNNFDPEESSEDNFNVQKQIAVKVVENNIEYDYTSSGTDTPSLLLQQRLFNQNCDSTKFSPNISNCNLMSNNERISEIDSLFKGLRIAEFRAERKKLNNLPGNERCRCKDHQCDNSLKLSEGSFDGSAISIQSAVITEPMNILVPIQYISKCNPLELRFTFLLKVQNLDSELPLENQYKLIGTTGTTTNCGEEISKVSTTMYSGLIMPLGDSNTQLQEKEVKSSDQADFESGGNNLIQADSLNLEDNYPESPEGIGDRLEYNGLNERRDWYESLKRSGERGLQRMSWIYGNLKDRVIQKYLRNVEN
ncbi:MAG: hypothetical protein MHMPM18_003400 [Marteilia pararefringens]